MINLKDNREAAMKELYRLGADEDFDTNFKNFIDEKENDPVYQDLITEYKEAVLKRDQIFWRLTHNTEARKFGIKFENVAGNKTFMEAVSAVTELEENILMKRYKELLQKES